MEAMSGMVERPDQFGGATRVATLPAAVAAGAAPRLGALREHHCASRFAATRKMLNRIRKPKNSFLHMIFILNGTSVTILALGRILHEASLLSQEPFPSNLVYFSGDKEFSGTPISS